MSMNDTLESQSPLQISKFVFKIIFHRESANSLYLDLTFDESSFEKFFEKLDPTDFKRDGQPLQSQPGSEMEIKLSSLKIVNKDFLYEIEGGLKAFETYLFDTFGQDV